VQTLFIWPLGTALALAGLLVAQRLRLAA